TAVDASVRSPSGMDSSSDGSVYFADGGNGRVRKVAPNGTISTVAGNGPVSDFYTNSNDGQRATDVSIFPRDVAVGPDDTLYILDPHSERILHVDSNGRIWTVAGNGDRGGAVIPGSPGTQSPIGEAWRIAVGIDGSVY